MIFQPSSNFWRFIVVSPATFLWELGKLMVHQVRASARSGLSSRKGSPDSLRMGGAPSIGRIGPVIASCQNSIGLYVESPDFDSAYNVAEERIAQSYKGPFTVQALQLIDVGKREPSVRFKVQWSPLRLFRLRKNAAQMHGGAFDRP